MVVDEAYGDEEAIAACRSVLIGVLTILGKHRDYLIVVGGWVPPLLFGPGEHIGSLDVDLAIDARRAPNYVYETVHNELGKAGYRPTNLANRFEHDVVRGNRTFTVQLDLITGEAGVAEGQTYRLVQGTPVWCARGVDVVFEHYVEATITGTLPKGGDNTVRVRVATAAAFIVMKAMALNERLKEKDAYDIYYCVANHPQGVGGLVVEFRPMLAESLVANAMRYIRSKFSTIDSVGPVWAAQIVRADGGDYDFALRDAFERVSTLLDALGVTGENV